MRDKYVLDKNELFNLIKSIHASLYDDRKITPIKLQKGLYLLFAHWGANIRNSKNMNTEVDSAKEFSEYLFEPSFEAWSYGPVDRGIYDIYKTAEGKKYKASKAAKYLESQDEFVQNFLKDIVPQIFNSSDFGLVNLTHKDSCWIDNYNPDKPYDSKSINPDLIISEYAKKAHN